LFNKYHHKSSVVEYGSIEMFDLDS